MTSAQDFILLMLYLELSRPSWFIRRKRDVIKMDTSTFKDLKNITMLHDFGTKQGQLAAQQITLKNPVAVSILLVSLKDRLGPNHTYSLGWLKIKPSKS